MSATETPAAAPSSDRVAGWKARSDRGPHVATLPSGETVTVVIPDSDSLIRAGRLPSGLTEIAVMAAAYPDGADGYMADLAFRALSDDTMDPDAKAKATDKLARTVKEGLELRDWLVSEMLVDPAVKPEDVAHLPKQDVDMLLAFAERRLDTDARGVKLPIMVAGDLARFRDEPDGGQGDAARESDRGDVPVVDGGVDGVPV